MQTLSGDYCPSCGVDVSTYALVNNKCPRCLSTEFAFDRIARVAVYDGTMRSLILRFKNSGTELRDFLSQMAFSLLQAAPFRDDIDLLVPVPLHWTRRLKRGYNQSYLIAGKLKNKAKLDISTDLLRIRRTKQQSLKVTPASRAANVKNAFAVRPDHNFTGRNICLIDDIKTTGATLNECARTLKTAGARNVYALVLAVAGQDIT
jgi:ComF family protein